MNPKNEAEWKAINQKEKDGQLTGGLGAGWTPDETLTSTDLLAKAPPTPTTPSLVRRFTLGSARIGRAPTLRNLAQIEANKSGKVIEVILETEPKEDDENYVGMDLSSMEGSSTTRSATFDTVTGSGWARRRTTLPTKTEVYHPQANWKPFSMRWPYLSALIAISVGCQKSLDSASVILKPDRKTRKENPHGDKTIHIDAVWSRFLSALLMVIAIFGSILLWQLEKRRSGLVADVKGIAGIAAMANKSHILNDFKDMDTATPDAIHDRLKKHRYTLRNSSLAPDSDNVLTREEADKYDQKKKTDSNPHPFGNVSGTDFAKPKPDKRSLLASLLSRDGEDDDDNKGLGEKMNNDEMVKRLGKIGKTYGLGWFAGRDGDMHCGVDQEELSSNYKHGENVKLTNQPWNSHWEDY
ncbi:hypothetical protein M7I_0373 [Glarea lozoyensis 74030]|uniref:Uncharacterized protein n=1 Tax=Glarea lozoyensis (strain ATCC 74030 / MF5533) TaxID=1104152 RepID=H0ED72_GLAL7|nr:hypothetical protein M7I_0373 [Glarea lozoyensis 74030]